MGALTDWINGGRLDLLLDAVKAVTDQLPDSGALSSLATAAALATVDSNVDTILTGQPAQKYNGARGPGVYVDTGAANTNTVLGTDGTVGNPVSTLAAAITLAASVGAKRIYLKGSSTLALTGQTLDGYEFIGLNGSDSNTINLGTAASPSILSNVDIIGCTVYGTHDFSDRLSVTECELTDAPAAEVTSLYVYAMKSLVIGDIQLNTASDNVFVNCSDGAPGGTAPTITATGATGTILIDNWDGPLALQNLSASHNVRVSGSGALTFESGCNVNASVQIYGHWTETDNTAGMSNVTRGAEYNRDAVNAECDTALSDYDPPTNAEMQARTLAAADYFDPAADAVANVTLVATCTTNTDMRGTDNALLASSAPTNFGDLSIEVTTGLVSLAADQSGVTVGTVNAMAGTITTLDALDTAQDSQHSTTQGKVDTAQADLDILTGTDGVTIATAQPNYAPATATALATAQTDLDTITGADGVTLATVQGNYAPAVAGNQMDLVNAPNATAVTAIQNGLATSSALTTVGSNVTAIKAITDALTAAAAAKLATSAGTIVTGTVSTATTTPTTTVFAADDITEATADHFNGRIVIFTSGALANQATDITDYALDTGEGKFTVTALTESPSNNDTFVIV
jgi:hypothetical protein